MDIMKELQKPFTIEELEFRIGAQTKDKTKAIPLVYVTNRAIQNRLDEIFTPFGWKNEYKQWKEGQLCGISVLHNNEWITKWDGSSDTKIESLKGGLSDSMKRAAVQWGIGRYLYESENIWVPIVNGRMNLTLKDKQRILKGEILDSEIKPTQPDILEDNKKSSSGTSLLTPMTTKQRECIFGFMKKKACNKEDLDGYIQEKYKKRMSELSTTEASQIITFVKDLLEQTEIDKLLHIVKNKGFNEAQVLKAAKKTNLKFLTGDDYQVLINRISKAKTKEVENVYPDEMLNI